MGRRSTARLGAAVLTGSVAMLVAALPAVADTPAHGKYKDPAAGDMGYAVQVKGESGPVRAELINLQLDDHDATTLKTYCVQIDVGLQQQDR